MNQRDIALELARGVAVGGTSTQEVRMLSEVLVSEAALTQELRDLLVLAQTNASKEKGKLLQETDKFVLCMKAVDSKVEELKEVLRWIKAELDKGNLEQVHGNAHIMHQQIDKALA